MGGFIESKSALDKQLKSGWLDTKTRCLDVEFQMYTPNLDSVTMVEIRMTTECGLIYMISADVSTKLLNIYLITIFYFNYKKLT